MAEMTLFHVRLFSAILIAAWASYTDIKYRLIKNYQVVSCLMIGLLLWMVDGFSLVYPLMGLSVGTLLALVGRGRLGAGDVKLIGTMGFLTGIQVSAILLLALGLLGLRGSIVGSGKEPFAPFVLCGCITVLVLGKPI